MAFAEQVRSDDFRISRSTLRRGVRAIGAAMGGDLAQFTFGIWALKAWNGCLYKRWVTRST